MATPTASREEAFLRLVRGETTGVSASLARMGLTLASWPYRVGVGLRNLAFDRGWKVAHRADVPVISVGNLTLGGTGKTPMVEYLARWYRNHGLRVAVLSRGYGREGAVNDEALVLEENLPDVPHLQDPDRVAMARLAIEELESQILVLDDAFQHRRLARDLDIVLLDALDPFGLGRLFPRGLLREPASSLRRAGLVVLSRADLVSPEARAEIERVIQRAAGSKPVVLTRHAPLGLIAPGVDEPLESLRGKTVAAFCGIGNPEGFRRTLEPLCERLTSLRVFPDHHPYSAEDVADLQRWARGERVDLVLTTQKDLVKLRLADLGLVPLRALRIGLEVLAGEDHLQQALAAVVARVPTD